MKRCSASLANEQIKAAVRCLYTPHGMAGIGKTGPCHWGYEVTVILIR